MSNYGHLMRRSPITGLADELALMDNLISKHPERAAMWREDFAKNARTILNAVHAEAMERAAAADPRFDTVQYSRFWPLS